MNLSKQQVKYKPERYGGTLEPTSVIGISSSGDSRLRVLMSVLSCVLVTAAVFCLAKIFVDGFRLFGAPSIEPVRTSFKPSQVRLFYLGVIAGSGLICAANALYRHSAKAICSLLALYVIVFGRGYRLVANGFIRLINKGFYTVLLQQRKTASQYYLTYFELEDAAPEKEIMYFLFAVLFAMAFLLAYLGVRRCSAFLFAAITLGVTAFPVALDCFESEGCLVALVVICLVMYACRVQGWRRSSPKNTVSSFGSTLKINGKYSAFPAFQQAMIYIVCASLILSAANAAIGFDTFKRSDKADELAKELMYTAETIASGTALDSLGVGTSSALNNGRLSRLGDLDFTGKTMFEVKAKTSNPLYLRSYSSANYTGRRWEQLGPRLYRSYTFWDGFAEDGFYPQFTHNADNASPLYEPASIEVTIKNRSINHRIALTDCRLIPEMSDDLLDKANSKYDGCFTFARFVGESSYKQTIYAKSELLYSPWFFGGLPSSDAPAAVASVVKSGDFNSPNSFYGDYFDDTGEYAEFLENEKTYRAFAADNYLSYPDDIGDWLPGDFDETAQMLFDESVSCLDAGTSYFDIGNYYGAMESYIRRYLQDSAEYTLEPGRTPARRDFVEYFINENHKGYCVHFATAAVLMLRRAGIPARYCEGYIVTHENLTDRDAGGFAKVLDSSSHAWAEVYSPLTGWQAVEFTPYYSDGTQPEENKPPESDSDEEAETESDTDEETDSDTETDSDSAAETDTDTESDTASDSETAAPEAPASPGSTPTAPKAASKLLMFLKSLLKALLLIAFIAAAWLLLRLAVCRIRWLRFLRTDTKKAALAMYFYSLRVMRLMGASKRKGEGEEAFASRAAKLPINAGSKALHEFTRAALSARFGKDPPSGETIRSMQAFIKKLTGNMYASKPRWKKLIIKYILFFD